VSDKTPSGGVWEADDDSNSVSLRIGTKIFVDRSRKSMISDNQSPGNLNRGGSEIFARNRANIMNLNDN
jgi:hypothetical protein